MLVLSIGLAPLRRGDVQFIGLPGEGLSLADGGRFIEPPQYHFIGHSVDDFPGDDLGPFPGRAFLAFLPFKERRFTHHDQAQERQLSGLVIAVIIGIDIFDQAPRRVERSSGSAQLPIIFNQHKANLFALGQRLELLGHALDTFPLLAYGIDRRDGNQVLVLFSLAVAALDPAAQFDAIFSALYIQHRTGFGVAALGVEDTLARGLDVQALGILQEAAPRLRRAGRRRNEERRIAGVVEPGAVFLPERIDAGFPGVREVLAGRGICPDFRERF